MGMYGERHGLSAMEAWQLLDLARAEQREPEIETRFLDGRLSLDTGSLMERVLANPVLAEKKQEWLEKAVSMSTKDFRYTLKKALEEQRLQAPSIPMTVFLSAEGKRNFDDAKAIASRQAERALNDSETVDAVVNHFLDDFDKLRVPEGTRRMGPTKGMKSRKVPASVEREVRDRSDDKCTITQYCWQSATTTAGWTWPTSSTRRPSAPARRPRTSASSASPTTGWRRRSGSRPCATAT